MLALDMEDLRVRIARRETLRISGVLKSASGLLLSCALPAAVGDQCAIHAADDHVVLAEVIGFSQDTSFLVPFETTLEARPGLRVTHLGTSANRALATPRTISH